MCWLSGYRKSEPWDLESEIRGTLTRQQYVLPAYHQEPNLHPQHTYQLYCLYTYVLISFLWEIEASCVLEPFNNNWTPIGQRGDKYSLMGFEVLDGFLTNCDHGLE